MRVLTYARAGSLSTQALRTPSWIDGLKGDAQGADISSKLTLLPSSVSLGIRLHSRIKRGRFDLSFDGTSLLRIISFCDTGTSDFALDTIN
jgi:hypothetical protein